MTNCMEGIGGKRPDIMLVGDCPTTTDDETGEPFAGDSGKKLRYLLKKAGVKRSRTYWTNAIKCKPFNAARINKPHIQACQKHLFMEIIKKRPKVILAMGNRPLESLLGFKKTTDHRGYFYEWEITYKGKKISTWVVPTYGMGACLTKWEFDQMVVKDLQKVQQFADTGKLPKKLKVDTFVVDDLKKLKKAKEELLSAKMLVGDLETTSLLLDKAEIVMIGFSPKIGRAVVIPFFVYDIDEHGKKWDDENKQYAKKLNNFVGRHKEVIRETVAEVCASPIPKGGQNFKYDEKLFKKFRMPVKKWTWDTIVAHSLENENVPHSLTWMLNWYNIHHLSSNEGEYGPYEHDLWKYVNKEKKTKKPYSYVPPLLLADYLAKDLDGTRRVKKPVEQRVRDEGLWDLYKKQQIPLVRRLAEFEYTGICCNTVQLQSISKKFNAELAGTESKLKNMVAKPDFNPKSPKQVREYLTKIDTPLEKKTKGGDLSTDKKVLEHLSTSRRKWGKFSRLLIKHREITKLKSTYLDGSDGSGGMVGQIDQRGKIHTNYNAHTPRTGRLSSSDPNLQNIPRPSIKYPWANIRQCFHPTRPDWVIFSVDYQQIEMRIAAYLSRDYVMIQEIADKVDLHTRNCVMFGTVLGFIPAGMTEKKFKKIRHYEPPNNWDVKLKGAKREDVELAIQMAAEFDEHRTFAKAVGFGLNYGIHASTLATDHDRDVDDVQEAIDLYFKKYERLKDWRDDQCALWIEKGCLVLPETGRKRRFTGASEWFNSKYSKDIKKRAWDIANVDRQAMNFPIQGYANEIFTQGKLRLLTAMKKEKMRSRCLLSLHDGILGEGPKSEFKELIPMAKETMERTLGAGKKYETHLGIDFDAYDRWAGNKVKL